MKVREKEFEITLEEALEDVEYRVTKFY